MNFESSPHSPVSPAIVESLRHPAMWGSFVSLSEEIRHNALDQDRTALSELAKQFLLRFRKKVSRPFPEIKAHRVEEALRMICAAAPNDSSELNLTTHWIRPLAPLLDERVASTLYDEAVSYGLVIEDSKGVWTWRHGFVRDHLRGG